MFDLLAHRNALIVILVSLLIFCAALSLRTLASLSSAPFTEKIDEELFELHIGEESTIGGKGCSE
jgi:hypothetical protein